MHKILEFKRTNIIQGWTEIIEILIQMQQCMDIINCRYVSKKSIFIHNKKLQQIFCKIGVKFSEFCISFNSMEITSWNEENVDKLLCVISFLEQVGQYKAKTDGTLWISIYPIRQVIWADEKILRAFFCSEHLNWQKVPPFVDLKACIVLALVSEKQASV